MRAWVLHGVNKICFEEVERPSPGRGEALVAVKAAGICGSDIPRIYGTGAHVHPLVPGHEFSGVVEAAGQDVDVGWLGKRVGVFPLIPCGRCLPCGRGQYEMCRHYDYLGSRRNGGFAEYVTAPVENLMELPDGVSFQEAAMLEPMAVAAHAIRRVMPDGLPAGEGAVAVCGLGTIGLLLVMLLLERSRADGNADGEMPDEGPASRHRILVIGNKDFQKRRVMEMGIPEEAYCDSRRQDAGGWLMERTGGGGADIFFECVGKSETFAQAVDNAAPGGRICLVGNPYSDMPLEKDVYWKILRNQLTVTGTWNSSFMSGGGAADGGAAARSRTEKDAARGGVTMAGETDDDWAYVLQRLAKKRIMPENLISHRFPLEKLEQGLRIMRDKSEDYIKIMVT